MDIYYKCKRKRHNFIYLYFSGLLRTVLVPRQPPAGPSHHNLQPPGTYQCSPVLHGSQEPEQEKIFWIKLLWNIKQGVFIGISMGKVQLSYLCKYDDRGTVGNGLREQQTKVWLIMVWTKGICHTSCNYDIDTREHGVEEAHPAAIGNLHCQGVWAWDGWVIWGQ